MALESVFSYFRAYDKAAFHVVACQGSEPSESDVAAFERTAGLRLPEEFREFTKSPLGGLYIEVREELWPPAVAYAVGPFWSFLRAIKVFGIAARIPHWLDIRVQFEAFRELGRAQLVPFLQLEGDANMYCFDRSGAIAYWDHETSELEPVARSFSEVLLEELHELEERKNLKLAGQGRP